MKNAIKKAVSVVLIFCVCLLSACDIAGLFEVVKSPSTPVHLIGEDRAEKNPVRKIDSCPEKKVEGDTFYDRQEDLLRIVESGNRPTFGDEASDVKAVYDAAIAMLNRYMISSYIDYERVHAIHDYICSTVEYDDELYNKYLSGASVKKEHDSFNIVGVLVNKKAVCDGISKAFSLLCGIEGIASARIVGEYAINGKYSAHAWNKVEITGKWYNVDCTLDTVRIAADDKVQSLVCHGYFLLSDKVFESRPFGGHKADPDIAMNPVNEVATDSYPVYENTYINIGGKDYSSLITSKDELSNILSAVKKAGRKNIGKLDIKIRIDGIDNSKETAYDELFASALAIFGKTDFSFDVESGARPFLRHPDGAVLLLIYA